MHGQPHITSDLQMTDIFTNDSRKINCNIAIVTLQLQHCKSWCQEGGGSHPLGYTPYIIVAVKDISEESMYPEGGGIRLLRNTDDRPQGSAIHGLRANVSVCRRAIYRGVGIFFAGSMHVGILVNKVELGQVVFQFLCFSRRYNSKSVQ